MDIGSTSLLSPLPRLAPLTSPKSADEMGGMGSGASAFQNVLGQVLGAQGAANAKADQAIQALATGQTDDLHGVSLAVAQADLTFRMLLEMRNRLSDAFQEITRMQV